MRLNYYQFPQGTDRQILLNEGCEPIWAFDVPGRENISEEDAANTCLALGMTGEEMMDYLDSHKRIKDVEDTLAAVSVTRAKQLLKLYGGCAWTEHYDRDGGMFETTEIRIGKNNSTFKYNHHL